MQKMVATAFNPSTWQANQPLGVSTTFHGRPHAQEQLADQHQIDTIGYQIKSLVAGKSSLFLSCWSVEP